MSEAGYVALTLSQLHISFSESLTHEELSLRVDVEICNNGGVFHFAKNNESKFSSAVGKAAQLAMSEEQPLEGGAQEGEGEVKDEGGNEENGASTTAIPKAVYILGLDDTYLKTCYIDLNAEVLNALANASISIKVMGVGMGGDNAAAAAAAAPPAKGKAPAAAAPVPTGSSDECLLEVLIPLKDLLTTKGNCINGHHFSESKFVNIHKQTIMTELSSLTYSLACDNDMAEYVLGSVVAQWGGAHMSCPPSLWSLHYADVVDAKAKVPPTAVELRAKYVENIGRIIGAQEGVAAYSLSIGSAPAEGAADEEGAEEPSLARKVLPLLTLTNGRVQFNSEAAAEVSPDEDIRSRCDLWSISWPASSCVFIHRTTVRQLAKISAADVASSPLVLPVKITKTPTNEGAASEGSEVSADGRIDVSNILLPGAGELTFDITDLTGADMDSVGEGFAFSAVFSPTSPIKKQEIDAGSITAKIKQTKPSDVTSSRQVSLNSKNRDVLRELRDEIAATIRLIAQEYLALYPNDLSSSKDTSVEEHVPTLSDRKSEFMYFLSTNGIYHDFKEKLKPKIQRVVRDRYGARGAALGKTSTGFAGEAVRADSQEQSTDQLLGELYVFLVKECNSVLNEIYGSTAIDRNIKELDQPALIDDEIESPSQLFDRLSVLSNDAEADGRLYAAEQLHLEKIQVVANNAVLGTKPVYVFAAYARYGEFLLRMGSSAAKQAQAYYGDASDALLAQMRAYTGKAREALSVAVKAKHDEWEAHVLLSCLLFESDQPELAEAEILAAINTQLLDGSLDSMDGFEGYESDKICPVHPLCYSILAAVYNMQSRPLASRKALRMISQSYSTGEYDPPLSTHGTPRRTLVLTLSSASLHLHKYGLTRLANECAAIASLCETAVTDKAQARGGPAATVPHIRHLLKRSSASQLAASAQLDAAIDMAFESVDVAQAPLDMVEGYLLAARLQQQARREASLVCSAYLNAIKVSMDAVGIEDRPIVPLDAYIQTCKLLINSGRFSEAHSIALSACTHFPSAALLLLLGVCCLRLDRPEDAEDALQESNILDNRNSDTWAYLSVLCLSSGHSRVAEAEKALSQALRLGLGSSSLLRELATLFMAVDRLHVAEDLIRRAIALEISSSAEGGRANPRTRKLLADVLASQNEAVKAVEEYSLVISDDSTDVSTKLQAAEKCFQLLSSLGRQGEAASLAKIMVSLKELGGAEGAQVLAE